MKAFLNSEHVPLSPDKRMQFSRKNKIEITTPKATNLNTTTYSIEPNSTPHRSKRDTSSTGPRDLMTLAEENIRHSKKKDLISFPIFSQPIRIELPYIFNTPKRNIMPVSIIQANIAYKNELPTIKNICSEVVNTDERRKYQKRIKDYLLLAGACRRANKLRDEGRAYYSIGVLCDNILNFEQAVTYYFKFLEICRAVKDSYGEALAYNCIGVDYYYLAEINITYLKKSIEYHEYHREVMNDVYGRFISHINLGIAYKKCSTPFTR